MTKLVNQILQPVIAGMKLVGGPVDERWYWAALLPLGRHRLVPVLEWLGSSGDWGWRWMGRQGETILAQHVDLARRFFERPDQLGTPRRI